MALTVDRFKGIGKHSERLILGRNICPEFEKCAYGHIQIETISGIEFCLLDLGPIAL
jgi:hypothetical protein